MRIRSRAAAEVKMRTARRPSRFRPPPWRRAPSCKPFPCLSLNLPRSAARPAPCLPRRRNLRRAGCTSLRRRAPE